MAVRKAATVTHHRPAVTTWPTVSLLAILHIQSHRSDPVDVQFQNDEVLLPGCGQIKFLHGLNPDRRTTPQMHAKLPDKFFGVRQVEARAWVSADGYLSDLLLDQLAALV